VGADPLRVEAGFLFLDNDPARTFGLDFVFQGSGFIFFSEVVRARNFLEGFLQSNFRLQFSPDEVPSSTCSGCGYEGDLTFRAPGPPLPGSGWTPFTMRGTLAEFAPGSAQPLFQHALVGSGRMSASAPVSVLYLFDAPAAPVPEPSTLLLLSCGLAAAVGAKRRRRSEPDRHIVRQS
jgi:hypothetical protein